MSNQHNDRQSFRDAMASLSAAVNIITTQGPQGTCGLTATAVCSVTDTPPTVMVCINRNSEMNPIFRENGALCINILNHEQEELAKHFAGMTDATMEERFSWDIWQEGKLQQPLLHAALANLEGKIKDVQSVGSHDVLLVELENIQLNDEGHGLVYFQRRFHAVQAPQTEPVTTQPSTAANTEEVTETAEAV